MQPQSWLAPATLFFGFSVLALGPALGGDGRSTSGKGDPSGTSLIMGQLRSLFENWDLNKDQFLDRKELAKAFRGASALPYAPPMYDDGLTRKTRMTKYPDYEFLVELDQDHDGKISRAEFTDWARSYAVELKKLRDGQKKASSSQKKLQQGKLAANDKQKLTQELQQLQKTLADQRKALRYLQTIEKQLQQSHKKK
jgi:hypothetical protein